MAVSTLVATAGASNANTYCTRTASTQYDDDHPQSGTTWSSASNDLKDQSLLMATRLMDEHIEWTGAPSDVIQVLNWPRSGMWDRNGNAMDSDSIPNGVRDATAEFARQIIAVPDAVYYILESGWFAAVRKRGQMSAVLVRT